MLLQLQLMLRPMLEPESEPELKLELKLKLEPELKLKLLGFVIFMTLLLLLFWHCSHHKSQQIATLLARQ